jgi:hypothetical protein
MSYWHRRDALAWDMEGGWDGRVVMVDGIFVRYVDRNGDVREPITGMPPSNFVRHDHRAPQSHRPVRVRNAG